MTGRLERWMFEPRAPYDLAVLRVLVALCAFKPLIGGPDQLPRLLQVERPLATYAMLDPAGWAPISYLALLDVPAPTQQVLNVAWAVGVAGALLLLVGLATRVAAVAVAGSLLYLLPMMNSWGKVNHGYHVLAIAVLVLAFSRCGDAWSLDALLRRLRNASPRPPASWRYAWPVVSVQAAFALMFFFAGWNKLTVSGLEWVFSENMRNMLVMQNSIIREWENASAIVPLLVQHPALWMSAAFGGMFGELAFIGVLFTRRHKWLRRGFTMLGLGIAMGLDILMQLPNPVLVTLALCFIDWNGVRERARQLWNDLARTDRGSAVVGEVGREPALDVLD